MNHVSIVVAGIVFTLFSTVLRGENWPHWRGNHGNGVSASAHPPTEWSDSKNVKWKVVVPGRGSGSPVVWGDKVFVVTAVAAESGDGDRDLASESPQASRDSERARRGDRPDGRRRGRRGGRRGAPITNLQFKLLCFDRGTGELVWDRTATEAVPHQATHSTNGFASASPCVDGQHVYAHFGSRGLYAYTLDGELKWKRDDLGQMTTRNDFGEGSSPTLAGDAIIVPWDHEGESALFSLNRLTGDTIWKTDRDEPTCWATPLIVSHDGRQQVIMNGQNAARAYDLETGDEIWRCSGQTDRPIASAVAANGVVFIGSGYRGSFLGAFDLSGSGDIEDSNHVHWTLHRDTPDVASPLLSGGRLYFYKAKTGILSCVNAADGKPNYMTRRIDGIRNTYASPIAAGGYVYLTGRSGTTVVIRDSDKLQIVATNSVGETVDATPAPVDNELFIRGERHLFCIAE